MKSCFNSCQLKACLAFICIFPITLLIFFFLTNSLEIFQYVPLKDKDNFKTTQYHQHTQKNQYFFIFSYSDHVQISLIISNYCFLKIICSSKDPNKTHKLQLTDNTSLISGKLWHSEPEKLHYNFSKYLRLIMAVGEPERPNMFQK